MKRLLPFAVLLAACTGPTYLPDGGRVRQVCQNTPLPIAVIAQDIMGVAISGADVTARNPTSGITQTGTTGGDGRTTQITEDLGNGQVEITALAGSLATKRPFIVQLTCGECDCTAVPSSALLTLE